MSSKERQEQRQTGGTMGGKKEVGIEETPKKWEEGSRSKGSLRQPGVMTPERKSKQR